MIQKIIAITLIMCGIALFVVGNINLWLRHTAVGAVAFLAGLAVLFYSWAESAPHYDTRTSRYYRFAGDSDNPHHAFCPKCGQRSRIIYTVYGPRHYGIYCEVHSEQWSDLDRPIDIAMSKVAQLQTARAL
jgi:hypothetical protein